MGVEQGFEVNGLDNLEELVAGIAPQAAHGHRGVPQGDVLAVEQGLDGLEVETACPAVPQGITVIHEDDTHHTPEVVDAVRVEERHGPPFGPGRESAQEQITRLVGDIGRPRVALDSRLIVVHDAKKKKKTALPTSFCRKNAHLMHFLLPLQFRRISTHKKCNVYEIR